MFPDGIRGATLPFASAGGLRGPWANTVALGGAYRDVVRAKKIPKAWSRLSFPGERLALSHPEVLIALRRARDLTDRDFAQPLTLDSMVQAAHLSKFHFARAFTKAYGETPRTYLTRRRIERAKDLLRAANLTITEICFLVGFESVGSFSSRFRDLVGMSPTEYRSASAGAPPIPGCFVLMWTRPGLARSQQSGRSTEDGRAVASEP